MTMWRICQKSVRERKTKHQNERDKHAHCKHMYRTVENEWIQRYAENSGSQRNDQITEPGVEYFHELLNSFAASLLR